MFPLFHVFLSLPISLPSKGQLPGPELREPHRAADGGLAGDDDVGHAEDVLHRRAIGHHEVGHTGGEQRPGRRQGVDELEGLRKT